MAEVAQRGPAELAGTPAQYAPRRPPGQGPREAAAAVLRAYAHLLFSRSLAVGAILLCATAVSPRALAGGVACVGLALLFARALGVDREVVRDGSYGVSALFLGLGVGQSFGLGFAALVLLPVMAAASVVLTAALRSWLGQSHLPALSLPFLGAFYLLLAAATAARLPYALPAEEAIHAPAWLAEPLRSAGALLFLPRWEAGALLLLALTVHSRIALLLALLACAFTLELRALVPALGEPALFAPLTYNAIFTVIGVGGVWFVPSPASFLLALLGAALCALLTLGAAGPLGALGLPVLNLPFNATMILLLLATRQRAFDRRPKAVDFHPGTPEQNLAYFRTRLQRFRWLYPVRFRLPVRGAWICTQGEDGPLTHKGAWRHAFDFAVSGEGGHEHAGDGSAASQYFAFAQPVLAAAAGTVVKAVGHIPDNEPGTLNLEENWGNYVILYHGPGLYSMVAHLCAGSLRVWEGQAVREGQELGLCGNSGRSSQPHVHFQLQSGPLPGDATLPCRFTDVVTAGAGEVVQPALAPRAGQIARNLVPDDERASFFLFPYGAFYAFALDGAGPIEHVHSDVDLYGNYALRSREHGASLLYSLGDGFFTAYDLVGAPGSVLHLLRAALSRVPLETNEALRWGDYLPARMLRGRVLGVLVDFAAPFLPRDSVEMEYGARREGERLIVTGESRRRAADGAPLVRTRAELARGEAPVRVEVTLGARRYTLTRAAPLRAALPAPPAATAAIREAP